MSEMIERVARAIWEVNHPNPPGWAAWGDRSGFGPSEDERRLTIARARAAIGAMREPTLREREFLEGKTGCDWIAGWQAMIDAALSDDEVSAGIEGEG